MLKINNGNERGNFFNNYSKLTNELNNFVSTKKRSNEVEGANTVSLKKMNLLLKEKLIAKNNQQNNITVFSNEKNILDKNIFSDNIIKKEKWLSLKDEINIKKPYTTINSSNSVFDKIKNNLDIMKKEFTLEEAFQKNLGSLNDENIISPRNNILKNFNAKTTKNHENRANGISVKDPLLIINFNNSKNITSNFKYKLNKCYFNNQNDNQTNYNTDILDKTQEK